MNRVFGRQTRFLRSFGLSIRIVPIDALMPVQIVVTGAAINRTVSKIAKPSLIEPPGVLM